MVDLIPGLLASSHGDVRPLLDAQALSLLVGVGIPILVGILTKMNASSGLKAVLNALLSAVAGTLVAVGQVDSPEWRDLVISILNTWVVSVATHYGVWKPTGVTGTVAVATAGFGIGSPPVVETDEKGAES